MIRMTLPIIFMYNIEYRYSIYVFIVTRVIHVPNYLNQNNKLIFRFRLLIWGKIYECIKHNMSCQSLIKFSALFDQCI